MTEFDEDLFEGLRSWVAVNNPDSPVIPDDDISVGAIAMLIGEIDKLRAVVAELGHRCNWDAVLRQAQERNDALREAEQLEEQLEKTRQEMGDEMDRIVLDWHDKVKETEKELYRVKDSWHPPGGNCSGCGHPLVPMWVCEGIEDPECAGHDE